MPFPSTPPAPIPAPRPPTGPLAHYLTHPGPATSQLAHRLGHLLGPTTVRVGPVVAGVALVAAIVLMVIRRRQAARLLDGARLVRVLAPPDVDPLGAETLWANLVALLRPRWQRLLGGQPHLGFEITAGPAGLAMALWVPGAVPAGLVERAVEAAWPGARTETTDATPPLVGSGLATGGALVLAQPEQYPLRVDHKIDPLRPLLGALSGLGEDETACVQILARPVTGRRVAALHKAAVARRSGRPGGPLAEIVDLATPGPHTQPLAADPSRTNDVTAILRKASQSCWAVSVRYAVATTATDRHAAERLRGRAHAVGSAFAIYAGRNRFDRRRLPNPAQALASRRLGRGNLVSVAELAALAHLPTDTVVAGLARAGAKAVAPPPELAHPNPATGKVLGDAETGGRRPVALAVPDARYHLHVMGATGSGKSTLLTNLVLEDVEAGRGVVVIDPKGDLIVDIADRLPRGAEQRTVLIDPDDADASPVLNVLAGPDPDLTVDNLVGIFRSIFSAYWGPRTDDVLRSSCLTLLRYAEQTGTGTSLADIPRLLSDDTFRQPRIAAVREDTVGLGGFWTWYEAQSEGARAQVVGPLLNKLRAFLLRDFVRSVVGRPESSFDMGDVLDGAICLVRVPKGILGDETSKLLGSFVVAKVWQAATHRARLGQTARADSTLYVDEAQNFLNLPRSFDEMLAEARGYRLSMVLAHQHLGQLPPGLRDAVSANARTKVWFSMSPEDAHTLARHVSPELGEHDLAHLGAYQAAARLVVAGNEAPAFTLRTRPAPAPLPGRGEAVRRAARANHGRPVIRTAPVPLAGRVLPAALDHPSVDTEDPVGHPDPDPGGGGRVARAVPEGVPSGFRRGFRPGMDPPDRDEPAGQGDGGGSVSWADSIGERS